MTHKVNGSFSDSKRSMKHYFAVFLIYSLFIFFLSVDSLYALGVIHFNCLFKLITGYPCPFCGGIRAIVALVTLHPLEALKWNPLATALSLMAVCVGPFALLQLVYPSLFIHFRDRNSGNSKGTIRYHDPSSSPISFIQKAISNSHIIRSLVIAVCIFIALNWIWLIFLSPYSY